MKIRSFISITHLLCPLNTDCMFNRVTYALSIFIRQYQHIPKVINTPWYPHAKLLGICHYTCCDNIELIFKGTTVFRNKMWLLIGIIGWMNSEKACALKNQYRKEKKTKQLGQLDCTATHFYEIICFNLNFKRAQETEDIDQFEPKCWEPWQNRLSTWSQIINSLLTIFLICHIFMKDLRMFEDGSFWQ